MNPRLTLMAFLLLACAMPGTPTSGWALPVANNDLAISTRSIGIEGYATAVLPKPDYKPRPLDDRTELILRIERVTRQAEDKFQYDFYYIGFEPGAFNLVDYLVRPDGSRPDELENIRIKAQSILPEDHNGALLPSAQTPFPWIGGYRILLGVLFAVWVAGIAAYVVIKSRRPRPPAPEIEPPAPSLADRLRPLVEAAAAGAITAEDKARLERLLIGYWRERLALPDLRMAEALMRLKEHAEAGALIRALERWLHRPGGAKQAEVAALLEPYRNVPATADDGEPHAGRDAGAPSVAAAEGGAP